MAKILITGGAGFIGSHIVRKLVELGHEIVILDAFEQYSPPLTGQYSKYIKLRFQGLENSITFERGSTTNQEIISRIIKKHQPTRVIHLAAIPVAEISEKNIYESISNTCLGTANLLSAVEEYSLVERFVYTSSSMVYGNFLFDKITEDHPLTPVNIYGATKLFGEHLTKIAGIRSNLDYTIIRPSAVYGPTDLNRRVTQIFVENAVLKKPIKLFNNGEEKLDFTYVEDLADGFVLATFEPKAQNETFNITFGEARSLLDFAMILKSHFQDLQIEYVNKDAGFKRPKRGTLDPTKAKNLLGYNPKHNLELGLKRYIEFMKENLVEKQNNLVKN
ncbi:MAG: NAD-dependent epimerase/dehydratase family protein [Nanoarchaeota archaeon]